MSGLISNRYNANFNAIRENTYYTPNYNSRYQAEFNQNDRPNRKLVHFE